MIAVRQLKPQDVAGICDHTFLQRPESYRGKVADPLAEYDHELMAFLEQTAVLHPLPYAVCLRAEEIGRARRVLAAAGAGQVVLAATVGFPLGDNVSTSLKVAEVEEAVTAGASEIDTVLRWRALREGRVDLVARDLASVVNVAHQEGALVKVIFEVCELTAEHVLQACELCAEVGADFVKTSTGFGRGGANEESLRIMRQAFHGGIKIAGGVNAGNLGILLAAAMGETIEALDPLRIRIGESSLLLQNPPA